MPPSASTTAGVAGVVGLCLVRYDGRLSKASRSTFSGGIRWDAMVFSCRYSWSRWPFRRAPVGPMAWPARTHSGVTDRPPRRISFRSPCGCRPRPRPQRYRDAGFNLFVGLWSGPTEEQLQQLKQAGMLVICSQNAVARQHLNDPMIVGWMHGDEPDNAQSLGAGKGYGPPIMPAKIVESYNRLRAADPNRPVMLNLGQGVAWDDYIGRGVRRNHPEDYPEYIKGCDIASFDIYPAAHDNAKIAGNLWYVAYGVERLKKWAPGKVAWNCIECTRIQNKEQHKATPQQVRSEVWMALIHGSMGLIYFVHEWQPKFDESALLSDPAMLAAVSQVNHQIAELAPVLNSPTVIDGAQATSSNKEVPVAAMVKKQGPAVYVFAAAMRDGQTRTRLAVRGLSGPKAVEVLGENRTLEAKDGVFEDDFPSWGVHLYRIAVGV